MSLHRFLAAASLLAALGAAAHAQTMWVPTAPGAYTWNDPANWSPNTVPLSGTVNVNNDITGDQTITLDSSPNLNVLNLGDPSAPLVAPGAFGFTIAAGSGGPLQFSGASAALASVNGANVISAPITLNANLSVTHMNSPPPGGTPDQSGSLTLSGPINLNGNTLTVAATTSSLARLDRGVVITGVISGTGGLTKTFGNFLVLTAANDYTGPTTLTAGAIRLVGAGTFGSGNLSLSGNSQIFPVATFTRAIGTGANEVQLAGTGGFGAIDQDLTIDFGGSAAPIVWGTAGFTPTQFGLSSTSSNRTITLLNPIDLNGATREVRVDSGSAAIDAVIPTAISGTGGFTKSGDGTLVLSGVNSYTGETLLGSNGILRIENAAGLGGTGAGGQTRILGGARTNRVELAGGITVGEEIRIEGRTGGSNFSTALLGATGTNTLNGNIIFNAGGTEYNLSVSTGNSFTINGNITTTLGTGTNTRNLNLQGGGTGTITGIISNGATNDPMAVTKTGAGTWALAGASPHGYTGATTVNDGTLLVNGTLAAPASGAGVTVNTGGTLGGTGTINRAVTVAPGGTLLPGAGGAGVLTVSSVGAAVTFQDGANFATRITGGNPSGTPGGSTDSITTPTTNTVLRLTTGTLAVNPATVNIVVDGTGFGFTSFQEYSYQVGQVDGSDLSTLNITDPNRFQVLGFIADDFSLTGDLNGAIFLTFTPVPEPGTVLLVSGLGAVLAAGWRRSRPRPVV
jgi:autotransporter-associated beta strand protein